MQEVRFALGYNTLGIGAEPYVEYFAIFDQVVTVYLNAGATTTSSTVVVAASTPTPVALTLASASGFTAPARVVIDVDTRQEEVTVQSVSGSIITVQLSLAHTGTYLVTVVGGETMVRAFLKRIRAVMNQLSNGQVLASAGSGGLKRVDEIEWHGLSGASSAYAGTPFALLRKELMNLREELASLLGVTNLWRARQGAGLAFSAY